jgi:hypothetical protein
MEVINACNREEFLKKLIIKFEEGYSDRQSLIWELIDFLDWDKVYAYILATTFNNQPKYIEEDYAKGLVVIRDL